MTCSMRSGADQRLDVRDFGVLGRDEDLVDGDRLAVHVAHGDLGLAVGTQVVETSALRTAVRRSASCARGRSACGMSSGGLVARVAEHHALVAGADEVDRVDALAVLDLEGLVDALGDVGLCSWIAVTTPQVSASKPYLARV